MTHTSGQTYDFVSPLIIKWRASRGEEPWCGSTDEDKSTVPLVFQPGTGWAYGGGPDWAGKILERVTGESLEIYMSKNLWAPLGIKDITFFPHQRDDMKDRIADIAVLGPDGKAVDMPGFDIVLGLKECLGGGGAFATPAAHLTFLQAVLREDAKLLKPESYAELFKPQLDEQCREALDNLILTDPEQRNYLCPIFPPSAKKNWSLAGMLLEEEQPGWMRKGTVVWGGLPCLVWVSYMGKKRSFDLC